MLYKLAQHRLIEEKLRGGAGLGQSSDLAGGELGGPAVFILPIPLISPLCQYSVTSPVHIHTISMRSRMAVLLLSGAIDAFLHVLISFRVIFLTTHPPPPL